MNIFIIIFMVNIIIKLIKINLSNFYFCQFYKAINSKNKADFFCKKYDIKDIPTLDKSYALFK